jgi:DNA end-binding protein Ku
MARAIWSGSISFGLVNVPVKAYTAVRDHEVHFHRLERSTGARVRNRRVSEETGEEVEADDVEMGYELDKGHYVTFDPDELDELRPASTRTVEISDFVPLADIDPIYYERTYWLGPDGDDARRAYQLLLAAMEDQQRVAIGSVVMRTKQYLAAIRPLDGALAMSTMRFADEVVARRDLDELPARRTKPEPKELRLAGQIVDALASDWDPERYHDTYTEELKDLIRRKAEGEEITVEPAAETESNVVDLMEALQASLDQAGGRRGSGRSSSRGRGSRPSSKKASSKKASSGKASSKKASSGKASSKKASASSGKRSSSRKAS